MSIIVFFSRARRPSFLFYVPLPFLLLPFLFTLPHSQLFADVPFLYRTTSPPNTHRNPPAPTQPAHALRARLISWFLDTPPAPFGLHRMVLTGKAAGQDVGMWFGPSATAGALRLLCFSFVCLFLGNGIDVRELHIFPGWRILYFTLVLLPPSPLPPSFFSPVFSSFLFPPQSFGVLVLSTPSASIFIFLVLRTFLPSANA
jgi:hypothetical protein